MFFTRKLEHQNLVTTKIFSTYRIHNTELITRSHRVISWWIYPTRMSRRLCQNWLCLMTLCKRTRLLWECWWYWWCIVITSRKPSIRHRISDIGKCSISYRRQCCRCLVTHVIVGSRLGAQTSHHSTKTTQITINVRWSAARSACCAHTTGYVIIHISNTSNIGWTSYSLWDIGKSFWCLREWGGLYSNLRKKENTNIGNLFNKDFFFHHANIKLIMYKWCMY